MTLYEAHRNFDILLDKSSGESSYPSFLPEEKDFFLNTYIERFIKTRYSGLNVHKDGFQQSQKRTDDLRTMVKSITFDHNGIKTLDELVSSAYYVEYPEDYWIGLGETMYIGYPIGAAEDDLIIKRGDVEECTIENIDTRLKNSLSPHILHNGVAKPLRLYCDGKIMLYTDGTYFIPNYTITYIPKPDKLDFYAYPKFSITSTYAIGDKVSYNNKQYICTSAITTPGIWNAIKFEEIQITIMPDHTWDEIITGAVRLALENISEPRYQTFSQESQVIE
jgi:hypothetical protein